MAGKMGSGGGVWAVRVVRAKRAANRSRAAAEGRGQTGLPADFRQKAPEIHGSLVSPRRAPEKAAARPALRPAGKLKHAPPFIWPPCWWARGAGADGRWPWPFFRFRSPTPEWPGPLRIDRKSTR